MPEPYYADDQITLHHGDCLDVMRELPEASVDAIVTDPPYGLGFMGKAWDALPPGEEWAAECLRVLKPGGHLLAFGGTRTWHRVAVAIEDGGFEIRDSIAWLYGNGFPKSLDVSKAIDKAAGAEREVVGVRSYGDGHVQRSSADKLAPPIGTFARVQDDRLDTAPATDDARTWQGWGTALKPAFEPIVVARKPLAGTVAANVLEHGTGALNIDACRLGGGQDYLDKCASVVGLDSNRTGDAYGDWTGKRENSAHVAGRWPANVILDESQSEVLDEQSGDRPGFSTQRDLKDDADGGSFLGKRKGPARAGQVREGFNDQGGASRFFYVAKADQGERVKVDGIAHPTVKPLALMRWLVRLVTPPGGTVLEPFAGSGTTVEACLLEGFQCIAIEREADYLPLIESRIARRRDPVRAVKLSGDDGGLFDLLGEVGA